MSAGRSLGELTAEDFRGVLGSRFQVTATTAPPTRDAEVSSFEAELVEVTEHPRGASGGLRTPFSAVFHGPLAPVMPQGTYRVEHQQLGILELFLVPIGPELPAEPGLQPAAMRYEAVFG